MRHTRLATLITTALLVAGGAQALAAQRAVVTRAQQPRAYLGFSYDPTSVTEGGERRSAIVIREIVEDSPAEHAGLEVDDLVLSINDIRVSEQFVSSLSASLVPGDRVRLLVRRDGRDREITLEAARRPTGYGVLAVPRTDTWSYTVSPDSLRGRVRLYLDSALVALDTMRFPEFRIEATPGGGVWMFTDSSRLQLVPDSLWASHRRGRALIVPRDSLLLRFDSMWARGIPRAGAWSFRGDSLFGLYADSMVFRALPRAFSFNLDTLATVRVGPGVEGGRIFGLRGDSVFTFEAREGGFGIATFATRAIGGAELTDLNEDLGEYFGADEGVLVVRVPDRTPAARAGLEAGDVIVRVNGRDVASVAELRRAIGRTGEPIRLELIRRSTRRTIELRE